MIPIIYAKFFATKFFAIGQGTEKMYAYPLWLQLSHARQRLRSWVRLGRRLLGIIEEISPSLRTASSLLSDCESECFGLGVWIRRTERKS